MGGMQPVLLELGPISLYSFGVFIALGFAAGGFVTYRLAKQAGLPVANFIDYFLYAAVAGLIGARVWHLVFRPFEVNGFMQAFSLWGGGLAVHGGLVAALAALVFAWRRAKQPIGRWLDVTVIGTAVGLAIGKFGSFLNGDSFGIRTDLPIGVTFNNALAPANVMGGAIHPLQLYAAVLYAAVAYLLFRWWRSSRESGSVDHAPVGGASTLRDGTIFWRGVLLLCLVQFGLEFLHASIDAMYLGGIRIVSLVAGIGIIVSAVVLWRRSDKRLRRA